MIFKPTMPKYLLAILLLAAAMTGYQKEPFEELPEVQYRVMDSKAGKLLYTAFDQEEEVILTLHYEEGTLNEGKSIVPNLYRFSDRVMFEEFEDSSIIVNPNLTQTRSVVERQSRWFNGGKKMFFYFIPITFGSQYQTEIALRKPREVNKPMTIEFAIWSLNKQELDNGAKPYRISIPRVGLTGSEQTMNFLWNVEGLLEGYNQRDLVYRANGRWPDDGLRGEGDFSADHWEEIEDYDISEVVDSLESFLFNGKTVYYKQMVTITAENFDYMYCYGSKP